MNFTKWFKLKKPEQEEFYDVDDFNFNADILDTELKNVKDNYLPLAGGTVTGDVMINGALTVPNGIIRTNDTSKVMTIICTADKKSGANLVLGGKDATNNAGEFVITTTDGTNSFNLRGTPAGKLTWNDKNIVRSVNSVNADDNGNVTIDGLVKSVNGVNADDNGNVSITSVNHAISADSATKAIQDKNGAQIDTTYFKSANGTFAGIDYYRDVSNSLLRFNGGNTYNGGACLQLYGKNANDYQGHFDLVACTKEDASDAKQLIGTPAGKLTWNDKNIVRSVNSVNADDNGNVALTQLVTGLRTSNYLAGATGEALVSSTAPGGGYVAFTRGASTHGVFTTGVNAVQYELDYFSNDMINAGQGDGIKSVVLLNEEGNSIFHGTVFCTGKFFLNGYEVSVG